MLVVLFAAQARAQTPSFTDRTQVRYLDGGCNDLSQSELPVHFGLGAATSADSVRLEWADGVVGMRDLLRLLAAWD